MQRALPNYVLFYDDEELDERVKKMKGYYPALAFRTTIEAGWFDKILHSLNPKNSLEKVHIYSIGEPVAPQFDTP